MMTRNRPTETREERARAQYHAMTYRAETLLLPDGTRLGVVAVTHGPNTYRVAFDGFLPVACSCPDHTRRREREEEPENCKHEWAAEWWLTGNPPEPPRPAFDLEGEAARLASLEAEEQRQAQALRDRESCWEDHPARI
jgi:hypothetical protein